MKLSEDMRDRVDGISPPAHTCVKWIRQYADEVAQLEADLAKEKKRAADFLSAGASDALKMLDYKKENERLMERDKTMSDLLIEIYDMIELRIPKHDALLTGEDDGIERFEDAQGMVANRGSTTTAKG